MLLQHLLVEKGDLVILERINLKKHFIKDEPMQIANYLDENLVSFLEAETQENALTTLVDLLDKENKLSDRDAFYRAILEREKIVSTGIGISVAIPHAKLSGYDDFFIAIGIQKKEGIEWQALDGLPVRIIFMIGGPEDKQTQYLNILSMLTAAIKDEDRRKALLKATNSTDAIAIFKDL